MAGTPMGSRRLRRQRHPPCLEQCSRSLEGRNSSESGNQVQAHCLINCEAQEQEQRKEHQPACSDSGSPSDGKKAADTKNKVSGAKPAESATAAESRRRDASFFDDQSPSDFSCRDFDESSPYLPVAFLGRGAVGRVFLCIEKATGDRVAVKVVAKHPLRGRRRLQRQVMLEKEALVALSAGGRPVHPSVGHLRRSYQTADNLYFVLEYAGAICLREVLARLNCAGLRLSVEAARLWAGETAAALAAMRERGVVHMDIRPENIIVNEEGHLTLVDFDSALCIRSLQEQQQQQQGRKGECQQQREHLPDHPVDRKHQCFTSLRHVDSCDGARDSCGCSPWGSATGFSRDNVESRGRLLSPILSPYTGTPAYAPPELFVSLDLLGEEAARQQLCCGFGTDCWSFGCLVHELLTGELPFKGDSPVALARGARQLALSEQLPAAAADFLKRLLLPKESERLGARDVTELLQHPFFQGLDCMSLHYQPLPIDMTQYAFAFRSSKQGPRTAAEEADACHSASSSAEPPGAVCTAAMEVDLTPSVGGCSSPLKTAASEALQSCSSCGTSKICACEGRGTDAYPLSPISKSVGSSRGGQVALEEKFRARYSCGRSRSDVELEKGCGIMEEQQFAQRQQSELFCLPSEATEEPRARCRCAVTEATLGWGPPLRLRPLSSADCSPSASDREAAAGGAAAGGAAADGEDSGMLSGTSGSVPVGVSTAPLELGQSFRGSDQAAQRDILALSGDPPFAVRWMLKGERVRYHGVLFRMREHRTFCERIFHRLFGRGHKRRNCQLQPQRCLALLTDAGRLLLLDPSGRSLRKTVRLAADGEIYTEGRDMLIYTSAEDGCYLLFASEADTVAAWARSLALSIEGLRQRAATVRPQTTASAREAEMVERAGFSQEVESGRKSEGHIGFRPQNENSAARRPSLLVQTRVRRRSLTDGFPIEEASVPTAATATTRVYPDRSGGSLPRQNTVAPRGQEPPRGRRGSLRTLPVSSFEVPALRRQRSEGPPVRFSRRTLDADA